MIKFVVGFVLGLAVATVGFSGMARILDSGVQTIQQTTKELAQ
jgi:NO-binding membrane sensor protein with MHYT domain